MAKEVKKAAASKKPVAKPAAKPAKAAKPAAKKAETKPVEKKNEGTRVYHVVKRKEDNKWAVKFAGGEKVIKLFDTKVEAEAYTKKMAENQGGVMLTHASKGKSKGRIQ